MNKINFGQPKPPVSKIGPVSTNQNVAQAAPPAVTAGASEKNIRIDTYFTQVPVNGEPTPIIYEGDRMWGRVTLTLLTAGPVAVGQSSSISPVTSGRGVLLQTGVPVVFDVAKGDRLYVAATGVNRINRAVQALPWLETITGLATSMLTQMAKTSGSLLASGKR